MSFGIRHLPEYLAKADRLLRRKRAVSDVATPPFLFFQAKSVSKVIKADIYPEFGTYPGGGDVPHHPFGSEKNAEREVIHGRWAMLGVTGAWAAENGTGIPGSPPVPSAPPTTAPPSPTSSPAQRRNNAPEGPATPPSGPFSFEVVPLAERRPSARASLTPSSTTPPSVTSPPADASTPSASLSPATSEELKIKELKHCRLSMFAWLGCIMQGLATQEGPIANWQAHVADPVHANVLTNAASGFGFY